MDAEEDAGRRRGVVIYIFIYLKASKRQMELLEKKSTTSNKHFPRNLIPPAYISGTALYISNTTTLFSKNQILARYQFVVHVPGPLLRVDNPLPFHAAVIFYVNHSVIMIFVGVPLGTSTVVRMTRT